MATGPYPADNLSSSVRQNFTLKLLSLGISVLLYFYVQAERNPTITRTVLAPVITEHVPAGILADIDSSPVSMAITGPKSIVDRLKDGDIQAIADVRRAPVGRASKLRLAIRAQSLSPEMIGALSIEPALSSREVVLQPIALKRLSVALKIDPPAPGYQLGRPAITPSIVRVTGRQDFVARVAQIIAAPAQADSHSDVDDDVTLAPVDADGDPVAQVTITPGIAHVYVPVVREIPSRFATVSPDIVQPSAPFHLSSVSVEPDQVKLTGEPGKLRLVFTINTVPIVLAPKAGTAIRTARLIVPPGLQASDARGHSISRVRVTVNVVAIPDGSSHAPQLSVPAQNDGPQ